MNSRTITTTFEFLDMVVVIDNSLGFFAVSNQTLPLDKFICTVVSNLINDWNVKQLLGGASLSDQISERKELH